jgi:hypothetical protein
MLLPGVGVDQDVVDKNYDELVQLLHEDLVHEVSRGISEPEGYNSELMMPVARHKGSIGNILFPDLHLVIT